MKQIELEVGKTYINRKGEEVKIVKFAESHLWPYQGSDGRYYTESGRRFFFSKEAPESLIAEVPEVRHTFTIPDGVKELTVEQVGNRIVVEMVPGKAPKPSRGSMPKYENPPAPPEKGPKPGDVMVSRLGGVYILKSVVSESAHRHYAWLGKDGRLAIDTLCYFGRPATAEEAQRLWDALKKAGKRWNAETMQVEEVPKPGDVMINEKGSVYIFKEVRGYGESHKPFVWLGEDGSLVPGGACHPGRPATSEEAQLLWDALKKAGKRWNPETMQVEDVPEIERIREWLRVWAAEGDYDFQALAEVIEGYLKHKEGEK